MVCLDTDIIVALLRGDNKAIETIEELQRMGMQFKTTIITAYELLKGAAISSKSSENIKTVKELLHNVTILGLDIDACGKAGLIYSDLRRSGKMISEFDILIAAIVQHNRETLITRDKHFQEITTINIRQW